MGGSWSISETLDRRETEAAAGAAAEKTRLATGTPGRADAPPHRSTGVMRRPPNACSVGTISMVETLTRHGAPTA